MKALQKILYISSLTLLCGVNTLHAQVAKAPEPFFNGPIVSDISTSSAIVRLDFNVISAWSDPADLNSLYFEYYKTNQVCIAIYPTPTECLPKKTTPGLTSTWLRDLDPKTSYTVVYKKDNTIRCITTPCPENGFTSLPVTFTTLGEGANNDKPLAFTKNFGYRARSVDVTKLQVLLIQKGFMSGKPTGYFGVVTLKAVKDLQRSYNITPTGFLGPLTRTAIGYEVIATEQGEYFQGKISAVSTGCYSDGECSITIDGKKVVTTIGWSQQIVGKIYGSVQSVGEAESKIGTNAKVYAKKTADGNYTLYGSEKYYIEVK